MSLLHIDIDQAEIHLRYLSTLRIGFADSRSTPALATLGAFIVRSNDTSAG